jgi:transcription antitermination factor NusG
MNGDKNEYKTESNYEEKVKKKLDKIIEQTSIENNALKKILESLQELNTENKTINNKKQKKR